MALEYYQKTREATPERIWGLPLLGTYLYTFNLRRPELQDVRVRQALAMTIDRHLLTEKVSGQGEQPAWSLLPGMPGHEALSSPWPCRISRPGWPERRRCWPRRAMTVNILSS